MGNYSDLYIRPQGAEAKETGLSSLLRAIFARPIRVYVCLFLGYRMVARQQSMLKKIGAVF